MGKLINPPFFQNLFPPAGCDPKVFSCNLATARFLVEAAIEEPDSLIRLEKQAAVLTSLALGAHAYRTEIKRWIEGNLRQGNVWDFASPFHERARDFLDYIAKRRAPLPLPSPVDVRQKFVEMKAARGICGVVHSL